MLIGLTRIKIKGLGINIDQGCWFFFYTQTDFKSSKIYKEWMDRDVS